MDRIDSDPSFVPAPVRLARPLIQRFCRSRHCPPEHRWHARSTLPVLALFVGTIEEPSSRGLAWEALDPDALLCASLEVDPDERAFLRDLFDVSASFYAFLAEEHLVPGPRASAIRARLAQLAVGLRSVA
ncbi:MAG TPA: hypothetical protein VIL20_20955 [Sandaracinaceae bacterium]